MAGDYSPHLGTWRQYHSLRQKESEGVKVPGVGETRVSGSAGSLLMGRETPEVAAMDRCP